MNDMSAFRTTPQGEFKAEDEALRAGIKAVAPDYIRWTRAGKNRSRRFKRRVALFPGYLLANGKPEHKAVRFKGNSDTGFTMQERTEASKYVRHCLGKLSDDEVAQVSSISGKEVDPEYVPPPPKIDWQPGEEAYINYGPLEGTAVTVKELRGNVALVEGVTHGAFRQISLHRSRLSRPPD